MNGLFNILGKKNFKSSSSGANIKIKELVKSFGSHMKEVKQQLKEKSGISSRSFKFFGKEKEADNDSSMIKQKISEFIKNNFKEKGYKSDTKSFFLCLAEEYNKITSNILHTAQNIINPNNQMTNDSIISFIKNFYEFEDDLLYISNKEILNEISNNEEDSFYLSLTNILSYAKLCDVVDYIVEKDNNLTDIGVKTVLILNAFHKITKYLNAMQINKNLNYRENISVLSSESVYSVEENKLFHTNIYKAVGYIMPIFVNVFSTFISDPGMKTVFLLMENGDLAKIFNDLANMRLIRINLYDVILKMNTSIKDGIKIRNFRKFIIENSCLDGMLSCIRNNYYVNEYEVYNDIFKEVIYLLIIFNGFYEDQNDLKLELFEFLLHIFEDLTNLVDLDNFKEISKKSVKEIFYLSYLNKDDISNKLSDKSFKHLESTLYLVSNLSLYKDLNIIDFLLDLFDFAGKLPNKSNQEDDTNSNFNTNLNIISNETYSVSTSEKKINNSVYEKTEHLRKLILLCILGEEPSLNKYKFIINNTSYCAKILENLHKFSEEMISYPLNTLLDMLTENNYNASTTPIHVSSSEQGYSLSYIPEKELKAIMKSIVNCENEEILTAILKHFKTFLDFSTFFQKLFINCGFFNKIVEILEKSLFSLEVNSDLVKNDNTNCNQNDSKSEDFNTNYKTTKLADNYFHKKKNDESKFNENLDSQYKPFTAEMINKLLKITELVLNNRNENIFIFKNYFFLDNYFDRLITYSEYKLTAYKIWNISMLYEQDPVELTKYTKFLLRRYYVLKDSLTKSKEISSLKIILDEIYRINEIICINFLNENFTNGINNNNYTFVKEVLLDFVNILNSIKDNKDIIEIKDAFNIQIEHNGERVQNLDILNSLKSIYWDSELQNILKCFLKNLLNLIMQYNKNIFAIKFKMYKYQINKKINKNIEPLVRKQDFKLLINKSISLLNEYEEKSYLLDLIKFLIDSSLRFKLNERGLNQSSSSKKISLVNNEKRNSKTREYLSTQLDERLFIFNLKEYYKNTFKVTETFLNNSYLSISNYSNFILQSPMIIKIILSSLKKINNLEILFEFLEFFDFLCKVNENNIKILLKQKIIKILLDIFRIYLPVKVDDENYKQSSEIINKVIEIFEIISKFLSKNDIELFFEFILTSVAKINLNGKTDNYVITVNRLLTIFYKNLSFSRKLKRNVVLSSIITRQPCIYNMLYTGNIRFNHPNQLKEILSEYDSNSVYNLNSKNKLSNVSIFLSLKFHKKLDGPTFTLFKFEKENTKEKDMQSFEVCIENNILVVKENDKEVYNFDELTKHIRIEKNINFLFILSKDSNHMEIFINEKRFYAPQLDFKFLDINASYNLFTGYTGSCTQELYQDTFQIFPHVSLSYMMVYSDKITKENMIHFKLSQIFNSKNGSAKANRIKLKYLNEKSYKMFAPHYINQKEILKYVKLNIEPEKIIYELVADRYELMTNNKLVKLKLDTNICNNFIFKINRKYNIDLMDKDFIVYFPNTNHMNVEGFLNSSSIMNPVIFNNTFVLSKVNFSDSIYINQIFDIKNIKSTILNEVIGIHSKSIIDSEVQGSRLINYLLMIISELGESSNEIQLQNCNYAVQIMCNVMKILSFYLISNLYELNHFCDSPDFKAFLTILYKNHKILTTEIIDNILNLSFGVEDMKGINFFNPWYPKWITDILLDIHFFRIISAELKVYILNKIVTFLNQKNFIFIMYEANIETKVAIITKLYKIFMLTESNDEIDEMIISLINTLLEQTLKFKKGDVEPTEEQLNRIISGTQEFFFICGYFNESITNHLKLRDFDTNELNTTQYLVRKFYSKVFKDNTKIFMTKIFNFFTKIREEVTSSGSVLGRRGTSINVGVKVGNLLRSSFFKKLYSNEEEGDKKTRNEKHKAVSNNNLHKSLQINTKLSKNVNSRNTNTPIEIKLGPLNNPFTKEDTRKIDKFHFNHSSWEVVSHSENKNLNKSNIDEEFIISEDKKFSITNANFDMDFECIGPSCCLCGFFRDSIKNSFNIIKSFNTFKKYAKNFYYLLYHKSPGKKHTEEYFKSKGLNFSWHIFNHEGPSRIKNKLVAKIDDIKNEELTKKYYEDFERIISEENMHKNSLFNRIFNFMDIKTIFSEVLYTDQIFNLNIIKSLVSDDDKPIASFNCLLIQECYHLDCVLLLCENKFYIFVNLHLDPDGNILYSKIKFKRSFWVLNEYRKEWERACPYLNNFIPVELNNLSGLDIINNNQPDEELSVMKKYEMNSNLRKITDEIKMYKFSRSRKDNKVISYNYKDINEIHKRRFLLTHNSLEIFMKNGKNFLLCFNVDKRDQVFLYLLKGINNKDKNNKTNNISGTNNLQSNYCVYLNKPKIIVKKSKGKYNKKKEIKTLIDYKQLLEEFSEKWAEGIISNYSYLIILNTLSGRSYSDISQYFIMPWIIKEYYSDGLNLNTDEIYRNLQNPIHALDEYSKKNLRDKLSEVTDEIDKFHSGSHYSSPGFVCYYLIRLKPFSYISAEIQGGYFDMANRLFFNIKSLWDVSDKYQELIPEVFYLPEIFSNYNEFDFGLNESQINVNDVLLPLWAKSDPRIFVKMTKKAMESAKVSQKISEWIDLIFGYKQQGQEAFNNFNTFRSLCYEGKIDFSKLDEKEVEDKMIEIHEMGQIPTLLFNKVHPKKERHEKSFAFFSRPSYLMNFLPREKVYTISLDNNPRDMRGFYEISEPYMSSGEGGLSSFSLYNSDWDDKSAKIVDAMNTFSIVGVKKTLLGPKYINFIDFSMSKYSFTLVKPLAKICFEFNTYRESPISDLKATKDGKKILVAFSDGLIKLYKLKKEEDKVIHPDYEKKKEKTIFRFFKRGDSFKKVNVNLQSSPLQANINSLNLGSESPTKDNVIKLDGSNENNQFPAIKYFSNNEEWRDHFIHFNHSGLNLNRNHSKGSSLFSLSLLESINVINNPIKFMEICEAFSLLIVVDEMDIIYIFDLNKLKLFRQLDYPEIVKNLGSGSIKFIKICGLSGEFVVFSNYTVVMFNVNTVLIGNLNIKDYENSNNKIGKITCGIVKSLKNTESEIHLFTGHETGGLFMWRLQLNKIFSEDQNPNSIDENTELLNNILDTYRFAYNKKYYQWRIKTTFDLRFKFVPVNEFTNTKKNVAIRHLKLTEDSSMIITIHDDMTLTYYNYTDNFSKKIKNKNTSKICTQCNSQIGGSKINCSQCEKKLCSRCKIEV